MTYYNPHSQWSGSGFLQWFPAEPESNINYTPQGTYGNIVDPGYYQPQNQQSYNDQSSQFVGALHGAIGEVLPSAESHLRTVVGLGVPENAGTEPIISNDDTDSHNLSADSGDLEDEEDYRMAVIFNAIHIATRHECHHWRGRLCPKLRELWLEMIEGSDPTDHDVWLWVDGDEEWLQRGKFCRQLVERSFTGTDHKGDWLDAHLALRRRINRLRNNAGHPVERIRKATRAQRLAAIFWLTWNSSRVKALTIDLGHTPWGMFGPGEIAEDGRVEVCLICYLWTQTFPKTTSAWEEAVKKLQEDGCTCFEKTWHWKKPRLASWFNMLTWLDGKPPSLEVIGGSYANQCVRCRSWANSRYDEYRHKFESTYPEVLWDALCVQAVPGIGIFSSAWAVGLVSYLSKLVSAGAKQQVEQQLRSALKTSHEDIKYIPHINKHYPSRLRPLAACLFCTAGFLPHEEYPTQNVLIEIPDGILDDAPLAVILGGVAWFAACLSSYQSDDDDKHDGYWHHRFCWILEGCFEVFGDCPLPKLSAQGSAFCIGLCFDCPKEFGNKEPKRIFKTFTAMIVFLTNRNILLQCCQRCRILYTRFSSNATLPASVNESFVSTDAFDISLDHVTNTKESSHIDEGLIGMDAFTNITLNKSLTKEQLQSQLATKFTSLGRYMESVGLDLSVFISPNHSSRVSSILRPLDSAMGQVAKLSKSDKIEQIKIKLLEMLRSFNVFTSHGRLPWSTLESDLKKRGIALINWPAEVPRKHSNRGIYDLSAEHTDTLYHAIMHPDKEKCLRLRYLLPSAEPVTHTIEATRDVASSSRHPPQGEQENRPPKQARNTFKITTSTDFCGT